jgi:hypothetical protein
MCNSLILQDGNVKSVEIACDDFAAFAAAVHVTFPAWRTNRQVQLIQNAKTGTVTLRTLNGYSLSAAEVAAVSEIAASLDAPVAEDAKPEVTIPWHGGYQRFPTKRSRSIRRSSGKAAAGLKMGRGAAWVGGGL